MSKAIKDKIGSTIYDRIDTLKLSNVERNRALVTLYDAEIFVDGFAQAAKKIEQLWARLFLKPSLKH